MMENCAQCRHREPDSKQVERMIAGLVVFGSGLGASIADSRLCRRHDQFVSPDDRCSAFDAVHAVS
jgi:hypothetical protein